MKILAIDTSCDDTSVAVVECSDSKKKKIKVLSNIVSSQVKLHQPYGGVYPSLAKREHLKNLPLVLKQALQGAEGVRLLPAEIRAVAVTVGPGLEPCLWVGINFAQELASKWNVPIIPINHLEGHILANFLNNYPLPPANYQLFPSIALVISGGHTQLVLVKKIGDYEIIGQTRDDAAGECFDKTARILGLPYPGGPEIATEAAKFSISNFQFSNKIKVKLPRPMIYTKDYDFSFSGLKTAVLYAHKKQTAKTKKSKEYIALMAHEIQQAIIDILIKKTFKATHDFKAKSIMVGGGVSANTELKKQFEEKIEKEKLNFHLSFPESQMRLDNAAMIGFVACLAHKKPVKKLSDLEAKGHLKLQ